MLSHVTKSQPGSSTHIYSDAAWNMVDFFLLFPYNQTSLDVGKCENALAFINLWMKTQKHYL